jgi:signal transduction histidine kinase
MSHRRIFFTLERIAIAAQKRGMVRLSQVLLLWIVLLLWVILLQIAPLLAQERSYYESRLTVEQKVVGSHLLPFRTTSGLTLFFEFKRRAYGTLASNVASSWNGMDKANLRSSTLEGASVLAAERCSDSTCAILFERGDSLFLGEITPNLTFKYTVALSVSSSASSSILASANNGVGVKLLRVASGAAIALSIGDKLFWWNLALQSASAQSASEHGQSTASVRLLEEYSVSDCVVLNEFATTPNEPVCAVLQESGVRKNVIFLSRNGEELWNESLDVQRRTTLRRVSNRSVAACVEQGLTTTVYIIRPKQQLLSIGINTSPQHIGFLEETTRITVFALVQNNVSGRYSWEAVRVPFSGATFSETLRTFPDNVFMPLAVIPFADEFWCVFMNTVFVMNGGNEPLAAGRVNIRLEGSFQQEYAFKRTVREIAPKELFYLELGKETFLVSRTSVPLWWVRNIVRDSWLYGAFVLVLGIIGALLYIVRYQRRLLVTVFGAPGADAMIILDEEGKMQSLNESARILLNVAQEAPLSRLFQFYCVDAGALALSTFAREALKARRQVTKPITFQRTLPEGENTAAIEGLPDTEPHDYLFTAIPIQTRFGAMRGIMLIGKDITEELGKKKLGNWAQLAHDLQTNLAAIRLNAEKVATSGMNAEGQKILYQVNLIIKRVRDIITIGKSEDLETRVTDTAEICANVRKEFDETLFANVGFEVYAQHILFECDQLKLERALRNAVENGIRAMPDGEGVISIRAWFEQGTVCFQVQDTGEGMSADVQKNMMRKGFTTFGSKGGSGMGTMIMKYIVQLHGGEMLIQSEKGKGTAVQFRIPSRSAKHLHHLKPLEISGDELMSE